MMEFIKSRIFRYLIYMILFSFSKWLIGFEDTVLMMGTWILTDMEYYNEKQITHE